MPENPTMPASKRDVRLGAARIRMTEWAGDGPNAPRPFCGFLRKPRGVAGL